MRRERPVFAEIGFDLAGWGADGATYCQRDIEIGVVAAERLLPFYLEAIPNAADHNLVLGEAATKALATLAWAVMPWRNNDVVLRESPPMKLHTTHSLDNLLEMISEMQTISSVDHLTRFRKYAVQEVITTVLNDEFGPPVLVSLTPGRLIAAYAPLLRLLAAYSRWVDEESIDTNWSGVDDNGTDAEDCHPEELKRRAAAILAKVEQLELPREILNS